MGISDLAVVEGRAYWIRQRCELLDKDPPYSTNLITERCFPKISIAGDAGLPNGVTEMIIADKGRYALFYSKKVGAPSQRLGILHGCYHSLSDLAVEAGARECNLGERRFRQYDQNESPIEVACDLFAGALLVPFDVLDDMAPRVLFPRDPVERQVFNDEVDRLASRFGVPAGFINWRLYDLAKLRQTHFGTRR